jgi:ribose/xylose/arabinose/galactoside ABC-type transport system permease subunit
MNRFAFLLRHASWLLPGLTLLVVVLLVPAFRRPGYWIDLGELYFAPAALALALTPIMLTGGIDLSVGSVTVFASVVIGTLWQDLHWPLGLAVLGGVLAGFLAGVGNGLMVRLGVVPLVATLATRELFRGLAWSLSGTQPVKAFPPILGEIWDQTVLGVPVSWLALAGLFVLTWLVVHHTWIGRMVFAIGDNPTAARFAGVPVRRIELGLYAWAGLVAGICGVAVVMKYDTAKADAERSLELAAIACVVLGGLRVTGGAGHVAGTLLGVITYATLVGGLTSTSSTWRDTMTGIVLVVVAVANEAAARWSLAHNAGVAVPAIGEPP